MFLPILVLNCGSSSLKAAVICVDGRHLTDLSVRNFGSDACLTVDGIAAAVVAPDAAAAVRCALEALVSHGLKVTSLAAIGHRVVHGGARFVAPVLVDAAVESAIDTLGVLAPLHNPAALAGLRAAREHLPGLPHVAVFDTAFHATLPRRAREYALPGALVARLGLRRYGFHGTSHAHVAGRAAAWLGEPLARLRLITCHLGAGASVTAVEYGRSVETSMGYTPLEGLVMDSRAGDLDPGVILELLRSGVGVDELERLLHHESGLVGLAGCADMQQVEARARAGDDAARLAVQVYAHRVRKYIGAYAAVMGGVDAIVFTAGVGEHSALIRHRIAARFDFLGAELDPDRNQDARVSAAAPVAEISIARARCRMLVVACDEEAAIATATRALLAGQQSVVDRPEIPIAVSVRHVHLRTATVEALFGPGHRLTPLHALSQTGQFAAVETVTLVGPAGRIEHARVVGPERVADQAEVSRTDEFVLGVDAPVRESGDLARTPGLRIEGPVGAVVMAEGVICALRHIHMAPHDAVAHGVCDGDRVDVRVRSEDRELTFGDVRVRVREDFVLEMHVDTDEANAAGLRTGATGLLEVAAGGARLISRR